MATYKLPAFVAAHDIRTCFVCLAPLTPENYTLEHIVPQWMIRRFAQKKTAFMFGDHRVPFMDFLLPCCAQCNSELLAPVERKVAAILGREDVNLSDNDEAVMGSWAMKLSIAMEIYGWAADSAPEEGHVADCYANPEYWKRYVLRAVRNTPKEIKRSKKALDF